MTLSEVAVTGRDRFYRNAMWGAEGTKSRLLSELMGRGICPRRPAWPRTRCPVSARCSKRCARSTPPSWWLSASGRGGRRRSNRAARHAGCEAPRARSVVGSDGHRKARGWRLRRAASRRNAQVGIAHRSRRPARTANGARVDVLDELADADVRPPCRAGRAGRRRGRNRSGRTARHRPAFRQRSPRRPRPARRNVGRALRPLLEAAAPHLHDANALCSPRTDGVSNCRGRSSRREPDGARQAVTRCRW